MPITIYESVTCTFVCCHTLLLTSRQFIYNVTVSLQWRHNERDGVSNQQPRDCLLNRLFKAQIKGNIKAPRHWRWMRGIHRWPVTVQMARNAKNVPYWWLHHGNYALLPCLQSTRLHYIFAYHENFCSSHSETVIKNDWRIFRCMMPRISDIYICNVYISCLSSLINHVCR